MSNRHKVREAVLVQNQWGQIEKRKEEFGLDKRDADISIE